jgi:hypothetical protein
MQPVQNTSIQSLEYRDLPLEQLVESPTNPRKRYQQASLEELAQTFRSRGVLEPLLVGPIEPERFEIVAGSRRYRAARIAELQTVPACVREMTDAKALEVQCIDLSGVPRILSSMYSTFRFPLINSLHPVTCPDCWLISTTGICSSAANLEFFP